MVNMGWAMARETRVIARICRIRLIRPVIRLKGLRRFRNRSDRIHR